MKTMIKRRAFLKKSAAAGAFSVLGLAMPAGAFFTVLKKVPDIAVAKGKNYFLSAQKAVNLLGGMKSMIKPGQKVGLLINSDFTQLGAFVNPDISLAVIDLCNEAGAREIVCLQKVKDEYWKRSRFYEEMQDQVAEVKHVEANVFPAKFSEEHYKMVEKIAGARKLENVEVIREIDNCDVFINIPIAKHHPTTLYTGAIKNMMGLTTRKTNVHMHLGSGVKNDPEFLGQCLADINLYRRPDLVVVDATEFIISNGPAGPGELKKPDTVVAGRDIVAVDALCATYLDYSPYDITAIIKAHEAGLGKIDYLSLNIKEIFV